MELKIIGRIYNQYKTKFGIPRQSGLVKEPLSAIIFEPEYRDVNAVRGLEEYSHIWLLWHFSENEREGWSPTVRPPRLGGNKRMGVFATRSPFRPNPVGLSCVEIDHIEIGKDGPVIYVRGADLMDKTPIFDLKPYLPYVDSHPEAKAGFGGKVKEHFVEVEFSEETEKIPSQVIKEIREILAQDPKPGYQKEESRIYGMAYGDYEVKFCYREGKIIVLAIE